ncbi:MAG: outer membrane lipoprotein-sorting protein [Candidatus Bipolaricaulaceae bacterium]
MKAVSCLIALAMVGGAVAQGLGPEEILEKVRSVWQPESFHARVMIEEHRGGEPRRWEAEVWSEGEDKALIRILHPEEEAGSGYLVLDDDVWYYSPQAGVSIQLPALALSAGAFGGVAALEDLFRGTLSEECEVTVEARDGGWLLTLIPRPEAPVVWGRLELQVREDFAPLELRFLDQRGDLVRVARASRFINVNGKSFPTVLEIEEASGDRTVERFLEPRIGIDIPDEVFTLEFLEGR